MNRNNESIVEEDEIVYGDELDCIAKKMSKRKIIL